MKGVVFGMLEESVTRVHGEAAWDRVLVEAELLGGYTSLGNYPDDEFARLVTVTAALIGRPDNDTIRWFAREATPWLIERYPAFFAGHRSLKTFLPTLNDVIHPEVRKLYPGAIVPDFHLSTTPEGCLVLEYSSPRRMCAFAEGLIEGTAAYYREVVRLSQPRCMRRGDPTCQLVCDIGPAP